MTTIDSFYRKQCDKIDPSEVNAYIDAHLSEEDPTKLIIETSWGDITVDLTPAIKAGETVTHLSLGTENIKYRNEAGDLECISGEELANLIGVNNE